MIKEIEPTTEVKLLKNLNLLKRVCEVVTLNNEVVGDNKKDTNQ